jgi:hydrogenase/urease accessory protein HupE
LTATRRNVFLFCLLTSGRCFPPYRFFFPFDFFEPDGITLATVLAIELAMVATTPFLEVRFFAFVVVFDLLCALGAALDLVLVVAFFFAAVFAITDPLTRF